MTDSAPEGLLPNLAQGPEFLDPSHLPRPDLNHAEKFEPPPSKVSRREMKCEQCNEVQSKYTCPKCAFRSCSVDCVKKHKEERKCDGMPQKWTAVAKFSEYVPNTSIRDQTFLTDVRDKINPDIRSGQQLPGANASDNGSSGQDVACPQREERPRPHYTPVVHHLLQNSRLRRIWLNFTEESETAGSRHENFSDTIFWTVSLEFVKSVDWNPSPALVPSRSEISGEIEPAHDHSVTASAAEGGQVIVKTELLTNEELGPGQGTVKTECNNGNDVEDGELPEDGEVSEGENEQYIKKEPNEEVDVVCGPGSATCGEDPNGDDAIMTEDPNGAHVEGNTSLESYSYQVSNIPESLTVRTLIRQFSRPKAFGPLVSRSDLDMDKMAPFLGDPNQLMVFMPVECPNAQRFYPISQELTLLDNLRNKFVHGHPHLVVVHGQDPHNFAQPTEHEVNRMHEERREKYHAEGGGQRRFHPRFNQNRGSFGGHRRGGRGGGPPGGFRPQFNPQQRPQPNQRGPNRPQKRNYQSRDDPLENILSSNYVHPKDMQAMNVN